MGVVYVARCKVNGKPYVGKTDKTMRWRRMLHERDARNGSSLVFHRALRKYGFEAFEWKVLMRDNDPGILNECEIVLIRQLKSKVPNGYNLTDGGEGVSGLRVEHSVWTGRNHTEEAKEKNRVAHLGKKHSKKTKSKVRSSSLTIWAGRSDEEKDKIITPMHKSRIGSKHSKGTKEQIGQRIRQLWADPEYRLMMLAARAKA